MYNDLKTQINTYLKDHIESECAQQTLQQSVTYSLMAGGKRLRPAITLAICKIFHQELNADILRAACAVELLHTYSLIHDDLPAMDNDDLRRGEPTNHRRFGAGMATLAGDGLLTLAFQWLSDNNLSPKIRLSLVRQLSIAAGPSGMVAGQAMDIHDEGIKLPLGQLQQLHRMKTGALLRYSFLAGGIISEQSPQVNELLAKFGAAYGLAFQIYDDMMDVIGSVASMGKTVHKDQEEQKNTYPNLLGMDETKHQLSLALTAARQLQAELGQVTGQDFSELNEFLSYFKEE